MYQGRPALLQCEAEQAELFHRGTSISLATATPLQCLVGYWRLHTPRVRSDAPSICAAVLQRFERFEPQNACKAAGLEAPIVQT